MIYFWYFKARFFLLVVLHFFFQIWGGGGGGGKVLKMTSQLVNFRAFFTPTEQTVKLVRLTNSLY